MSETIKRPAISLKTHSVLHAIRMSPNSLRQVISVTLWSHHFFPPKRQTRRSVILSPNGRFHTFSPIKYHVMVCVIYDLSVVLPTIIPTIYIHPSTNWAISQLHCVFCVPFYRTTTQLIKVSFIINLVRFFLFVFHILYAGTHLLCRRVWWWRFYWTIYYNAEWLY